MPVIDELRTTAEITRAVEIRRMEEAVLTTPTARRRTTSTKSWEAIEAVLSKSKSRKCGTWGISYPTANPGALQKSGWTIPRARLAIFGDQQKRWRYRVTADCCSRSLKC